MEGDRIPGLYFTGDRSFLHLAQEVKDNVYGFCTGETIFSNEDLYQAFGAKAVLNKVQSLNMLLVSKQFKEEYERELNRLDSNKCFERSLSIRLHTFEEVLGTDEGEEDYELPRREEASRHRLGRDMADLYKTKHLTTVTSVHLEFYEAACWSYRR